LFLFMADEITDDDAARLLSALQQRGVLSSAQAQGLLQRSQPTVSRLLARLSSQVLVLGRGRSARYALPHPLLGLPARQALWWTHEDGRVEPWGTLSFVGGERVHVSAAGVDDLSQARLPWFLAPLRAQGFLGRLLAQRLAGH